MCVLQVGVDCWCVLQVGVDHWCVLQVDVDRWCMCYRWVLIAGVCVTGGC